MHIHRLVVRRDRIVASLIITNKWLTVVNRLRWNLGHWSLVVHHWSGNVVHIVGHRWNVIGGWDVVMMEGG